MSFSLADATKSKEHENLSGRLRPSGRFSFCQIFRKKRKRLENGTVRNLEGIALLMLRYDSVHGSTYTTWRAAYLSGLQAANRETPRTLGSSIAANSECVARRGSHGITARQRDILCWGANAIESVYGRENLSFLTLTLPDLSENDFDSVRENWYEVVHYVVKLIKERLRESGIETSVCGCTELQLERYEKCGRFYPHLHLVFRGRKGSKHSWCLTPYVLRSMWARSVCRFLYDYSGGWNASENVERVKHGSGAYLAKYISKCASKCHGTALHTWHPRDWIVLSRKVRSLYEQLSQSGYLCGRVLQKLAEQWQLGDGYKKSIFIRSESYGERKIGEWGWLKGWLIFPSYLDVHPLICVTNT